MPSICSTTGRRWLSPTAEHCDVSADELANSTDRRKVSRVQLEQNHARSLPSVVRLSFYDAALDYQVGERAPHRRATGHRRATQVPGSLYRSGGQGLAHRMIARAWAMRDKLTVRLPPRFLDLRQGSRIGLDGVVGEWTVAECTIDGFVMIASFGLPGSLQFPWSRTRAGWLRTRMGDCRRPARAGRSSGSDRGMGDLVANGAAGGVQCVQQLEKLRCSNNCRDAKFCFADSFPEDDLRPYGDTAGRRESRYG